MANERLPQRVRRLFRFPWRTGASVAQEVDEELRFHVEMRAAELIKAGRDAESAMREAWQAFGTLDDVREHAIAVNAGVMRRAMILEWIAGLVSDTRFAIRQARRAPLFTLTAVTTLALGIGANTAIFSVVHRLLIAPFPFADSDRLAWITIVDPRENSISLVDAQTFNGWQSRAHSFEAISSVGGGDVELRDGQRAEMVQGTTMSANMLSMLGVRPALGRGFTRADEVRGAQSVAMLSHDEWQTRYGGRPDVIGRTIEIDSVARVIVGVGPAGFTVPFGSDARGVWLPIGDSAGGRWVIGKLRKGVPIDAVNRELTAIAAQVLGKRMSPWESARAQREQDMYKSLSRGVLLLFASVGVVLLIACANVANLLLVRASSRKREFAIRTALGAGRARLARLLVAESLTIAVGSGAAGLAFAWGAIHAVIKLRPRGLEVLDAVAIEPAALAWTTIIAIGTGVVFGLAPVVFATPTGMTDGLKSGVRDTEGRRDARIVRSTMIVAEIALSVTLLAGAGLLVRSFRSLQNVDLGWNSTGLHSMTIDVGATTPRAQRRAMAAAFLGRLRQTPGIRDVVFASDLPPRTTANGDGLEPADRASSDAPRITSAGVYDVQPRFFATLGMRVRGRTFDADSSGRDSVPPNEVILSEGLAKRLWPNIDAIGQRLRVGKKVSTVVGVANDLTYPGESGPQWDLQFYRPWISTSRRRSPIVFRSELSERALQNAVQAAIRSVSPELSISSSTTSNEELRLNLAPTRFATALISGFAGVALILAVIGLYGVIAYAVNQRTREIGIRIALGAQPENIARLVLVRGVALVGAGLAIGIAMSIAGSRLLQAYLYGVSGRDPITYAGIIAILGAGALCAAYLPARRAMRVDPVVALSSE